MSRKKIDKIINNALEKCEELNEEQKQKAYDFIYKDFCFFEKHESYFSSRANLNFAIEIWLKNEKGLNEIKKC